MTLRQLRYVIAIVEKESITEAAKFLYISQPSLSSAVKDLENELGIQIFNRLPKGISLTADGVEFLSYARQIIESAELLEKRYKDTKDSKKLCSVSTQHYAFAVNAFVNLVKGINASEYEFTLRETRTYEIIEDVHKLRSEIGILYLNDFNKKVITMLLEENQLIFNPLFMARPHVFISVKHPLSGETKVCLEDLEEYPCLSFEQGEFNSFFFSEEILSVLHHKKTVRVSDRATLFNLLHGLNGYTISSGILSSDLNGEDIAAVPLDVDEHMMVGWISNTKAQLSDFARSYIDELKRLITNYGYELLSS